MSAKTKIHTVLKSVENTLKSRQKILGAIATEEAELQALIPARRAAEVALSDAETAGALGEQSDVSGARRRLDDAMRAIERQAARLAGLRSRLAQQAGEFKTRRDTIKAELHEYAAELRTDFAGEWVKGIAAYGALLGRRQAIESMAGKMDLSEPSAVAADLSAGELAPYKAVEHLEAAVEQIAGWRRAADWPEIDAHTPGVCQRYDPSKIYVLTRDFDSVTAGMLVIDVSFVPGTLAHLVNLGDAVPADSQQWKDSLLPARDAEAQIVADGRRAREEEAIEQDRTRLANYPAGPQTQPAWQPNQHDRRAAREALKPSSLVHPETMVPHTPRGQ